jgi:hypothetical protein
VLAQIRSRLEPLAALPGGALTASQQQQKHRLEGYLELCTLHKIKFQLDAVLAQAVAMIQRLNEEPDLRTIDQIEPLAARLRAVLAYDPEYAQARDVFHQLAAAYPEYVHEPVEEARTLSLASYQAPEMRIAITCRKADLEKQPLLQAKYPLYYVAAAPHSPDKDEAYHLRFSLKDLDDFSAFHEALRTRPGYRIQINGRLIQEQYFTDWLHCYVRFRKARTPNYCYGASPLTFNVFGCHKLYTPDLAKRLDLCWFSHGALDPHSGLFFVESATLLQHLNRQLSYCGFCPALTQEKLSIGLNVLPDALNPECDDRWQFWPPDGVPQGVVPTGQALVIASPDADFSRVEPADLIEVGPTPYIEKLLRYLKTGDPAHLGAQVYRGLSTCLHCGEPYKLHTLLCKKCRLDFWKYALHDLDSVLARLRSHTPIRLPESGQKPASDRVSQPTPPAVGASAAQSEDSGISFEQLWSDPQVQHMLTDDAPPASPPVATDASAAQRSERPAPAASAAQAEAYRESLRAIVAKRGLADGPSILPTLVEDQPYERLHWHEKLWGFVSKKYRERKAIETAFAPPRTESPFSQTPDSASEPLTFEEQSRSADSRIAELLGAGPLPTRRESDGRQAPQKTGSATGDGVQGEFGPEHAALLNAIKSLKSRPKSELSKRGVVRVVYLATMDKDLCPLCAYLDGMVMDPDDPATDIFSPPLYPGCTCRREYVLKTEKPQNWPRVTFTFPPKELLVYLEK